MCDDLLLDAVIDHSLSGIQHRISHTVDKLPLFFAILIKPVLGIEIVEIWLKDANRLSYEHHLFFLACIRLKSVDLPGDRTQALKIPVRSRGTRETLKLPCLSFAISMACQNKNRLLLFAQCDIA